MIMRRHSVPQIENYLVVRPNYILYVRFISQKKIGCIFGFTALRLQLPTVPTVSKVPLLSRDCAALNVDKSTVDTRHLITDFVLIFDHLR